jgi:hypothetical protein
MAAFLFEAFSTELVSPKNRQLVFDLGLAAGVVVQHFIPPRSRKRHDGRIDTQANRRQISASRANF